VKQGANRKRKDREREEKKEEKKRKRKKRKHVTTKAFNSLRHRRDRNER